MKSTSRKSAAWFRVVVMAWAAVLLGSITNVCVAFQDAESPPAGQEPGADDSGIGGLTEPDEAPRTVRDESEAIDPSNKDALAWYMSGQKALRQGELEAAEDAFRKSAEADSKSAVPLRALSMVLFRMGKVEEGLKTARTAMQMDPDDYQTRIELAVLFGSNRRFKESEILVEEALASKTLKQESFDFVHLHQLRAALNLQLENIGQAADSYEVILKALETPEAFSLTEKEHRVLLKNRLTSYEVTGRVLMDAGRINKAIVAFQALARTEGDVPGEHNLLLARALYQQDKLEDCEKNLNQYFDGGRRSRESLVLLRDLYENTSRSDALTAKLQELAEDTSDAGDVRMFLGQILLDQGKTDEAADVFQTILDTTGEADAYLGLVRVEVARRDAEGLIATLNRAARSRISTAEMAPLVSSISTVDEFSKELISACKSTYETKPGDLHPAVPWFCSLVASAIDLPVEEAELLKATLELNPDRELMVDTLDKYGINQLVQGEYEMSARIFEQMLSIPGLPPAMRVNTLYRVSAAYASIKDLGAARRAVNEALKMVPNEPQLIGRLALIEAADGNLDKAEALLIQSIGGLEPDSEQLIETRLRLAGIYLQKDEWDSAVDQYESVLQIPTLDEETRKTTRMGLSNALVQGGNMEKGEKVLEEVYQSDPNDPGVNNDLGYLYADQGKNLEQAEKMIRIAVEAQPENPAYLDSLGWVLFRLGKHQEALESLTKANSDPDYQDATLLEHQGDVHQALNQSAEASDLWKRALAVEEKSAKPDKSIVERLRKKINPTPTDEPKAESK